MAVSVAKEIRNPFDVTKATDFDDREIASTWVDFPGQGGFRSLVDPCSPVPRFILGGKGSGRTHLMRYYSSGLQAIRLSEGAMTSLESEGYVGVYVNSSTLNAGRFSGKAQTGEAWNAVFAYYFDLWLTSRLLMAVDELAVAIAIPSVSSGIPVTQFFDVAPATSDVPDALVHLRALLSELDTSINEAALTRQLKATIRSSPGRVPFEAIDHIGQLAHFAGLRFVILIDEFENFSDDQQRYVNTLIREKRPRTSLLVGARTGGVKTFATLSGELNRQGSEFEIVRLDSLHLKSMKDYRRFCRSLVSRRLIQAGFFNPADEAHVSKSLDDYFYRPKYTRLGEHETAFVSDSESSETKALEKLRRQLLEYRPLNVSDVDADAIVRALRFPASPLLEKLSVYQFYRAWNNREPLLPAALRIHDEAAAYAKGPRKSDLAISMGHFRGDMLAQLLSEYREKQRYLGLEEFIELSGGLPRGLLVILKHVFRWAHFNGEVAFSAEHSISAESQRSGVQDAARWFFQDLPGIGSDGARAQAATERLGNFLKALRFSDKPAESSLCTVSVNRDSLSERGRSVVDHCVEFSFLLHTPAGHKDRNTRMRRQKLQLHPLLCPIWDLPTSRRGVIELSLEEATAIFDESNSGQLVPTTRARLRRMNAPFRAGNDTNGTLPDLYD